MNSFSLCVSLCLTLFVSDISNRCVHSYKKIFIVTWCIVFSGCCWDQNVIIAAFSFNKGDLLKKPCLG